MFKFQTGKRYFGRFICDHDTKVFITVAKRTDKTIVTEKGERFRIKHWHDGSTEYINPCGSYSMAPIITAERIG